jgi:sporulation protein YlmC with PRC-barrel domain
MSQNANHVRSELSYLDARKVTLPTGVLADLDVVTSDGKPVGSIAGVVIEAAARCVRYYKVRSSGWLRNRHRYIDAAQLAQVDPERKVLRLLTPDVDTAHPDLSNVREFSDDDLLSAVFSPRAA